MQLVPAPATEKHPWVKLFPSTTSPVERREHLHCARCDERLVLVMPVGIKTLVGVIRGFEEAHVECGMFPERQAPPPPHFKTPQDWLDHGEVGTSSKTIWCVMEGKRCHSPGVPRDPDDFRRCHLLLEAFPGWRQRLPEVAKSFPEWTSLVAEWEALTVLFLAERTAGRAPKLYARLHELAEAVTP